MALRIRGWLPVALLALLIPAEAAAQPHEISFDSIEWLAADSSLILRGRVASVEQVGDPRLGGWERVTFRAEETLKGPPQTEIQFAALSSANPNPTPIKGWADDKKEILVFLADSRHLRFGNGVVMKYPYAPHTVFFEGSMLLLDARAGVQALSMALEPLSDPNDILRRTKAATRAAANKGPLSPMRVTIPAGFWSKRENLPVYSETGFGWAELNVPIDRRLEEVARSWTRSKSMEFRVCGVKALAPFKSRGNIAIVKRMLDDPDTGSWVFRDASKPVQVHEVREAAKDVLNQWYIPWEVVSPAALAAAREMVPIPAGEFTMGGTTPGTAPQRNVNVDDFWIGKTDVTVAQFRAFCKATRFKFDWAKYWPWTDKEDHPMVNVSWDDARAFCHWVSGELPTEAQWERAARGTDRRQFPWGNDWDDSKLQCWPNTLVGWHGTAPVGSFPGGASPYGCLDMAGNAWQWCLDAGGGSASDPGRRRAIRGGGLESDSYSTEYARCAGRALFDIPRRDADLGFRVAATRKLRLP